MFPQLHFYTLALNDKFRDYEMLKVSHQHAESHIAKEWERLKQRQKIEAMGREHEQEHLKDLEFNQDLCYRHFFDTVKKNSIML